MEALLKGFPTELLEREIFEKRTSWNLLYCKQTQDYYVEELLSLVDALGWTRFHFLGNSWGTLESLVLSLAPLKVGPNPHKITYCILLIYL